MAGIAQHRETIDLAKGMIMIATGTDPKTAFETLRWYSQTTNIKLHPTCPTRLVEAATGHRRQAGWVIEFLDGLPRA